MRNATVILCVLMMMPLLLAGCGEEKNVKNSNNLSETNMSSDQVAKTEDSLVRPTEEPEQAVEVQTGTVLPEEEDNMKITNQIALTINDQILTATLEDNSSAEALKELLADGPLTISMSDYGNMEKVGNIGTKLPTNNEQITTEVGDLILYMGSAFVIYYAPNSWNFTRLGKINDISVQELKDILGNDSVDVTLSLADSIE